MESNINHELFRTLQAATRADRRRQSVRAVVAVLFIVMVPIVFCFAYAKLF